VSRIRPYRKEDEAALRAMHAAQGLDYELPDVDHPLFFSRTVLVNEKDEPIRAVLGRLTSEAFFLEYPDQGSEFTRMREFLKLQEAACADGRARGIDSVHVWLPPEMKYTFGAQLCRVGWEHHTWLSFARRL